MPAWTNWLAEIDAAERIGTLAYIGHTADGALNTLLATGAKQIVVADGTFAPHEAAHVSADERVTALAASLGPAPLRTLPLYPATPPVFTGLARPTGILDLFPGLIAHDPVEVAAVSVGDLLSPYDGKLGTKVMCLPLVGVLPDLIEMVGALSEAHRPDHLLLRLQRPGLYENTPDENWVEIAFAEIGYWPAASDRSEPDFPELWLRHDPARLHSEQERKKLAEAKAARDEAERIKDERAQDLHHVKEALDMAEKRAADLSTDLDAAILERDQHKSRLEALEAELVELRHALERARHEVGIALQMQSLAEADLDELRDRYARHMSEKTALDALLEDITIKLRAAAGCSDIPETEVPSVAPAAGTDAGSDDRSPDRDPDSP